MPGVYGFVTDRPDDDAPARLDAMGRRMKHHPWYQEHRHVDGAAGLALGRISLGLVDRADQPASNEDRSLLAVMSGEVLDYREHRRGLVADGHVFRGDSHAELLLHGYEARGKAFFRELNGSFAAAIWEARSRRLILVNDRFGMKALYYARRPDRLLLASEIKALLADPGVGQGVDLKGAAQFFTYGQLLGEETLLGDVRLLPAAGWLTYDADDGRLALDRYWRAADGRVEGLNAEAEILDRLDAAFKRAVDRCTEGDHRFGLSLSGGLDSRTILAAVDHDRVPVQTVSLGMAGSIDLLAAERMARIAGCPHHAHVLDAAFLGRYEDHLRQMVQLTDGHYLDQCIVMPTLPLYRELGIEVLLRGHAGELMHLDKAYNFSHDRAALALRDAAELEGWLLGRLRAFMIDTVEGPLFAPGLQQQAEALSRESLLDCLRETEGIEPPAQRISHLFVSQRLRRETAQSMVLFGSLVETRLPFLDNDLVDLLLSTPPERKLSDRIQAHILRRQMPALLDVVNANTGARMGAGPLHRRFTQLRSKVLAKLGVPGYQPYERLGLWLRRELSPLVRRLLLGDRCLDGGLFDPGTVRRVVESHLAGRHNHTYLIMALMIFEQGRRQLLEPRGGAAPGHGDLAPPVHVAAASGAGS